MNNQKINIVEVPINELRASEYNPRKHSKEQTDQLKRRSALVELEPAFCDLIVKRHEALTNTKAKKLN